MGWQETSVPFHAETTALTRRRSHAQHGQRVGTRLDPLETSLARSREGVGPGIAAVLRAYDAVVSRRNQGATNHETAHGNLGTRRRASLPCAVAWPTKRSPP